MFKFVFYFLLTLVLCSLLISFMLPVYLSTTPGKEMMLEYANSNIPGKIRINNLVLSWFGPSQLDQLELVDPHGKTLISIDSVHIDTPLWRALLGGDLTGNLNNLNGSIVSDENGKTTLEQALSYQAFETPLSQLLDPLQLINVQASSNGDHITAKGSTKQGPIEGSFTAEGTRGQNPAGSIVATGFPVFIFDQILHAKANTPPTLLQHILGKELNLDMTLNDNTFRQKVSSSEITAEISGKLENDILTFDKPITLDLGVSPQAFEMIKKAYHKESLPVLTDKTNIHILLTDVIIPINDFESSKGKVSLQVDSLPLQEFFLQDLIVHLIVDPHATSQPATVKGNYKSTAATIENFELNIDNIPWKKLADNRDIPDMSGQLLVAKLHAGVHQIMNVRAPWFLQNKKFTSQFNFNLDTMPLHGHLSTSPFEKNRIPLALTLDQAPIILDCDGYIEKNVFRLNRPLTSELTVSKELSDYFLDEIVPLLNSAISGEAPIKMTISEKDFGIPLSDPSLETVMIPWASIDLGKIHFSREGKLAEVLSTLKLPYTDSFSVWFTPLYFSLQHGQLSLARLDMLVSDNIPLATWGYIDFPKDSVRMEVGLTGRALSASFGPLPLPKNYFLTLPLRGSTKNPTLDKTKIAAKLASFAAMATGPQGILVGALINLASGTFTDKIPEPTTNPLPWTIDAETPDKNAPKESAPEKNPVKEPLKKLQNGAEKLFNKLKG